MITLGERDWSTTIPWSALTLEHFKFYRNSPLFKPYWFEAAAKITKLHIKNCTLECDGFRFLLDFVPHLETLTMKDVKLRDIADLHRVTDDPPLTTDRAIPPIVTPLANLTFENMTRIEGCFMDYIVARTGRLKSLSIIECFQQKFTAADPGET
jgi:hypothetical protein